MVHGFTSSGVIESQYQGFAEAAKIGSLGDKYIDNGKVIQGILNAWSRSCVMLLVLTLHI